MTLSERINEDLKNAMKAGEKERTGTLRLIRAAMLELAKSGNEVTPDAEQKVIQKAARSRKEAIEQYRAANRADLVEKEEAELKIIEEYLPQQMGEDEIRNAVRAVIAETGASGPADFKLVMPKAMGVLRGKADGAKIQAIVKEELEPKGA